MTTPTRATTPDKAQLRRQIAVAVRRLSTDERREASERVCRQVMQSDEWQRARRVLLYEALPDEVSLAPLADLAQRLGKSIVMPDASPHAAPIDQPQSLDLALIPGRAFTADGLRLGRGGGWYDRQLTLMQCPLWGVGFACQMVAHVPTDPWDIRLDRIVVG